jgi:toxin ParE1/3/4
MVRIIRSVTARADLRNIWEYIARDDPGAADRFVRQLDAAIQVLAEHPNLGRHRPEFGAHLRSFPVGRYVIFYVAIHDGVHVYRVLHGSRYFDILLQ